MDDQRWRRWFEQHKPESRTGDALNGVLWDRAGKPLAIAFAMRGEELPAGTKGGGEKVGRLPRKNAYFQAIKVGGGKHGRASISKTTHAKRFIRAMEEWASDQGLQPKPARLAPKDKIGAARHRNARPINSQLWNLDLLIVSKHRSMKLDLLLPATDSDSCLSPVKDAIQNSGILDDDGRIVRDHTHGALGLEDEVRFRLWVEDYPVEVLDVWGVPFIGT